jgi:uncharacterized membrane protein YccC
VAPLCFSVSCFGTTMIDKFEAWTKRVYRPQEAKWKRPVLLILSLVIGVLCGAAGYAQFQYQWTNDEVWLVIGVFGFFSVIGTVVALFCKDYWVALVFGKK